MKEAKKLFYRYVFENLSVEILYADVWEGNINSIKSLESYGYKLIDISNEIFSKTGMQTKRYLFALSKDDYKLKSQNNFD